MYLYDVMRQRAGQEPVFGSGYSGDRANFRLFDRRGRAIIPREYIDLAREVRHRSRHE